MQSGMFTVQVTGNEIVVSRVNLKMVIIVTVYILIVCIHYGSTRK